MAHEIKLELYNFQIRERRTENRLNLDNFFGEEDFFAFFQVYIKSFDAQIEVNELKKKSFQFVSNKTTIASNKRMISGIIESGDYGFESRIVDRKSKRQKYKKEVDDLDIKPFYFLIHAPKGSETGMLVLQRLGGYGINNLFTSHFEQHFKEKNEGLIMDFYPFVSKALANEFIDDGAIKEFILRRYDLPADIADKLGLTNHTESILSVELKITAKQNASLPFNKKVQKFIKNPNAAFFDMKELPKIGFDGQHESSIKVKLGNNTRTIDLSDTLQIRPYYDINAQVDREASGHPVFDSIDKIAKELVNELKNEQK